MALIHWDESFATGNIEIDSQHKKLITVLNSFYNGIVLGNVDATKELIKELEEYTKYHFNSEERVYRELGYEGINEHIKMHESFIVKVEKYTDKLDSGKMILTLDISNFLRDWIVNHIKNEDLKAFKLIHKKDQSQ